LLRDVDEESRDFRLVRQAFEHVAEGLLDVFHLVLQGL
jgi:hypothetical protein